MGNLIPPLPLLLKKGRRSPFSHLCLIFIFNFMSGWQEKEKKLAREGGSPPFPIYVLFLCFLIFQLATNFGVLNGRRSPLLPSVSYFTFCFYVRVQFNLFYNIRQGGGIHPRAVSPVIIPAPPPPPFILFF